MGHLLLGYLRMYAGEDANGRRALNPIQVDTRDGSTTSFPELLVEAVRAAAGWRALGLSCGDYLGVYSWNRLELFPAILGAIFEGITVVLIVPFATRDELRHYLSLVKLKALLLEGNLLARVETNAKLIVIGPTSPLPEGSFSLDEMLRGGQAMGLDPATYRATAIPDTKEHVAVVAFSSGTSGQPKGVLIHNKALSLRSQDAWEVWRTFPDDVVLLTHPLSWTTGLVCVFACVCGGSTAVLHNYADERRVLDVMQRHKVTTWMTAPPRLVLLAQLVSDLKAKGCPPALDHLRFIRTVGSVLVPSVQVLAEEALGVPVLQLYGTTEACVIAAYKVPVPPNLGCRRSPARVKLGSTGLISPCSQLRIVDVASGQDLTEPGQRGEVRVKSEYLMKGYVDRDDGFDEQGFYCTGDVAYVDEEGYMFVVDRIKELLTFDEFDVAPAEIESVLASHRAVREACVVGRKHPRLDELPTAFVVLREGHSATEKELQDLVAGTLADHKRLRGGVFFVADIPKSTYGKMLRSKLRERLVDLPPVRDEDLV